MATVIDPENGEQSRLAARVPLRGRRVLDVGTGDGRLAVRCAAAGGRVVGVDPDLPEVIAGGRRLGDRLRLLPGDARRLPFPDEVFDVAVLSWSL